MPHVTVVAIVVGGSEEHNSAGRLRVEPGPTGLELVVYVQDQHNLPSVAHNSSPVRVECTDANGTVLVEGRHRWPFTGTDGGTTEAHVHQRIPAEDLAAIQRCRLADTDPALQGPLIDGSLR